MGHTTKTTAMSMTDVSSLFYNALYGLADKGIVTFRRNQNDAGTTSDYDITVNDNAYPWKGSSEATYRNEGYVDLASPVFRSGEFKSLKAKREVSGP